MLTASCSYCFCTFLIVLPCDIFTTKIKVKKVKVAHTRLLSIGFRSWSRFLAVSLQVTWIIIPAVGCHYFPPGLQLRGCYQFRCLVNRGTMGVNSLPRTVTWQRHGCNLNPGPSAPESSTLTTRLQSHLSANIDCCLCVNCFQHVLLPLYHL